MKFYEFVDSYTLAKRIGMADKDSTPEQFFDDMNTIAIQYQNAFFNRQSVIEYDWYKNQRPYYNVWPVVFDMVSKIKLDIPCSAVQLPPPGQVFCLRLPVGNPYKFEGGEVQTILFSSQKVSESIGSTKFVDGLCIMIDTGEKDPSKGYPIFLFKFFPWIGDKTVEEVSKILPYHESWHQGVKISTDIVDEAIKLAITTCLIYEDPEIVTPDVLARDKVGYEDALKKGDQEKVKKIIGRAKRRGKNAFDIGRLIEAMPHYRRPHMALFWTGAGRKIAKIKLRQGSIVHRDKIVNVPTDYIGDDLS